MLSITNGQYFQLSNRPCVEIAKKGFLLNRIQENLNIIDTPFGRKDKHMWLALMD